jgi:hypothetical protein
MNWRAILLAMILSLPLCSENLEIMYYNFVGDYLVERSYQVDINVLNASLKEIKFLLEALRHDEEINNADLVIIGYGPKGYADEFFAATYSINDEVPLRIMLKHVPTYDADSKWYIYYIDKSLSPYIRARYDHHESSPFRWLAHVGMQDLSYFQAIEPSFNNYSFKKFDYVCSSKDKNANILNNRLPFIATTKPHAPKNINCSCYFSRYLRRF